MKLTAIVLLLGGAGLATGAAMNYWPGTDETISSVPGEMVYTVQRGDLIVTLSENGELVAKDAQRITSETDSSGRITFLIEEGTEVEEGEILAKLDPTDLEERKEQLELEINQAEADLNTANTELEIQRGDNVASIEKAEIALDKANKDLERYIESDAPSDRRKLEIAIKEAETNHSRSKKKYEDSQKLFDQEFINRSQLEQDQIDFERAVVQLDGARRDLAAFEKYTLPMTTTERNSALADAVRGKEGANLRAGSMLRQKEVRVEQNDKKLTMRRKQLEEVIEEIGKFTMTAPGPGIVLYGDPDEPWYRENIRLGGDVWGSMVLFTLPDLRVMQVKLKIHEADINKLAEGQKAKVTMDTYPGVVLDGEVTRIASIASGTDRWSRDNEVKKFDVDLTLEARPELRLKPGISAKAEIFVEKKEDVLSVPLQCLFQEEGKHWCWLIGEDGDPERVAVTPGQSNDSYVEIMDGLDEGARVLLYNPKLPQAGSVPAGEDEDEDDAPGSEGEGEDAATPAASA